MMRQEDYTVGIICALSREAAAATAMLCESHSGLSQPPNDNNVYSLGRIQAHNVVIACLPAGSPGTTSAANVAIQLKNSFPLVKIGFMVGVGGGVPSAQHDVRLGDVVVSKPFGTSGGVIQYDLGKTGFEAEFERTGQLNRPPDVLLNAVSNLEAKHMLQGDELRNYMSEAKQKYPKMRDQWSYPGVQYDRLFQSDYEHAANSTECSLCDSTKLIYRKSRQSDAPVIHYGLIASGNQVIKHGSTRDKLADKLSVLCFEMEAAGLMDSFPCLVVRGICDYADTHKHKKWQDYAALVAAAYVKELLTVIPGTEISNTQPIADNRELTLYRPHNASFDNRSLREIDILPREAWPVEKLGHTTWIKLLQRLSDYDQEKVHRRLKSNRLEGTTEWFLHHPLVQNWITGSESASLWFSGGVGSGKTTVCTRLIDHLIEESREARSAVIYFYCDAAEQKTLRAPYLFRSLIKQLLAYIARAGKEHPSGIRQRIEQFYSPSGPEPDLEDVAYIYSVLFESEPDATYVVDGVDEMEPNEINSVLNTLYDVLKTSTNQKVLISSRDELGVNIKVSSTLRITLSKQDTEKDIRQFTHSEISKKTQRERALSENHEVVSQVKQRLLDEARGMFLWVHLQIEGLWLDCSCDEEVLEALDNLPPDLAATYDRCLKRIPAASSTMAAKALRWVISASRPLYVPELMEAVAFDLNHREWNAAKIPYRQIVTASCANLIIIDTTDDSVRLAHQSIKQHLFKSSSMFHIDEEKAILQCGEECVNYLSFSNFGLQLQQQSSRTFTAQMPSPSRILASLPLSNVTKQFSAVFTPRLTARKANMKISRPDRQVSQDSESDNYALLNYARQNWATQTRSISKASTMWNKFHRLALEPENPWKIHPWTPSGQSLDSHFHGLLSWATRERHMPLLTLLAENSAETHLKRFCNLPLVQDGLPALHAASRLGFADVVALLITFCRVNAPGPDSRTALYYAVEKNHVTVAEMLLSVKKNHISLQGGGAYALLNLAVRMGYYESVKLLLDKGAPRSIINDGSWPLLHTAVENGNADIFKLLLDRGADVSIASYQGQTPLYTAAENGNIDIVKMLLNRGADISITSERGETPLHRAAYTGYIDIVKLLLEKGADSSIASNIGWTPLHKAASSGYTNVVKILLEKGADSSVRDGVGRTPLTVAAEFGYTEVVKLLLDKSVGSSMTANEEWIPLYWAARQGHTEIVTILLEAGVDSSATDNYKGMALIDAIERNHPEVVKILLEKGADTSVTDYLEQTPLAIAARYGYTEVVKLLIEKGADSSITDGFKRTPLAMAAEYGHLGVVRLLQTYEDRQKTLHCTER